MVDADQCPRFLTNLLIEQEWPSTFVYCTFPPKRQGNLPIDSPFTTLVKVPQGLDSADRHILELTHEGDAVLSNDQELLVQAHYKGAYAIDFYGHLMTDQKAVQVITERMSRRRHFGYSHTKHFPLYTKDFALSVIAILQSIRKEIPMPKCLYCEEETNGGKYHKACIEAYGFDYDPTSEEDAKAFLERRKASYAALDAQVANEQ